MLILGAVAWFALRPAEELRVVVPSPVAGLKEIDSPARPDVASEDSEPTSTLSSARAAVEPRAPFTSVADGSPVSSLLARVLGENGEGVSGAHVRVLVHGELCGAEPTREDGSFRVEQLPRDTALVLAHMGDRVGRATFEPDSGLAVDVYLKAGGILRGRVIHGVDRRPMAGARVLALPTGMHLSTLPARGAGSFPEAFSDETGTFELAGLFVGARYALHATVEGHITPAAGFDAAVAAPSEESTELELEVLPLFAALVQFVQAESGEALPGSFSQISRLSFDGAPGPRFPPTGLALEQLGLTESCVDVAELHGIQALLFRVATLDSGPLGATVHVEATRFYSATAALTLELASPRIETQFVAVASSGGEQYPVTLRLLGYHGLAVQGLPKLLQVHIDSTDVGRTSQFSVFDVRGEIHLVLPSGEHALQVELGGGQVHLPGPGPEAWRRVFVQGPTAIDFEWPGAPSGIVLDVRQATGEPRWGMLMTYWARDRRPEAEGGPKGHVLQSLVLHDSPYFVPNVEPGLHRVWFDRLGVGPGHLFEVRERADPAEPPQRIRIDLPPR